MSGHRIKTLDGVRGLAILMVLAGHISQNLPGLTPQVRMWLMAVANSSAGVRLFFVLSGYLITTLLVQEIDRTGEVSIPRFYYRRILRIFPAFYCFLAAVVILERWHPTGQTPQALVSAAGFTWNYAFLWIHLPPAAAWNLGHLWTLALEQQFYLFWPLILATLGPKRSLWPALALVAWCPMARVATYYLVPSLRGDLGMMLHTAVDSIMIGCTAALIVAVYPRREWWTKFGHRLSACALIWLVIASPLVSTLVRGAPIAFGFTLDAIAAAGLIVTLHLGSESPLQKAFAIAPLRALGAISYSLYLWQQLFLSPARLHGPADAFVGVAIAIIVATGSYFFIEKPLLRLKPASATRTQPLATTS